MVRKIPKAAVAKESREESARTIESHCLVRLDPTDCITRARERSNK